MMRVDEVIGSYVRDVASYLPRDQRNDVAFELRALLRDELAERGAGAGRSPDREMVMELLAEHGRPAEVAARYRPRPALIDPADTHRFWIWALVGSLIVALDGSEPGGRILGWIGLVFLGFAGAAWLRRRHPGQFSWRPRPERLPAVASRPLVLLCGAATLLFPLAMYWAPQDWWSAVTFGHGVSGGLRLSEAFAGSWQRIATLVALATTVALYAAVTVQGGWRRWSRRALIVTYAAVGLLLAIHAGPLMTLIGREAFEIFESAQANRVAPPLFGLVGGLTLLSALYEAFREWTRIRPEPMVEVEAAG